jgi:hypothetical protein
MDLCTIPHNLEHSMMHRSREKHQFRDSDAKARLGIRNSSSLVAALSA